MTAKPLKDGRASGPRKSTINQAQRSNFLSVASGFYKGLRLVAPGAPTHPMGAREKNALFNILQPWLAGATVLDAYAGSGALGIEALSRGAESATFVENHPRAIKTLRSNLEIVIRATYGSEHIPEATIHTTRSSEHTLAITTHSANNPEYTLKNTPKAQKTIVFSPKITLFPENIAKITENPRLAGRYSLIIADPPYDGFSAAEVAKLAKNLKNGGILALSYPAKLDKVMLPGLELLTTRRYAAAGIAIYRKSL